MPATKPKVVPVDIGVVPEAAVSGAMLIQDEYSAWLIFNAVREESGRRLDAGTAVVRLINCVKTKFGHPNDEALPGHPLYAEGIDRYEIAEVIDSPWSNSVVQQNRISFPDTPDSYGRRHFVFTFHDSTFECLAEDLEVTVSSEPRDQIEQSIIKYPSNYIP